MPERSIDETFLALPLERLGQAALGRARDFGVTHADFRLERVRYQYFSVRDGALEGAQDAEDLGLAVRVVLDGAWGFASGVALTESEAVALAETAITVARVAAQMTSRPVELAPEPVHAGVTWVSSYDVDPFDVPLAEKTGLFTGWTRELMAADGIDHATGGVLSVHENKYYADLSGSSITQQRVRVEPYLEVHASDPATGAFDAMRTIAPPVGKGWEAFSDGAFDFDTERERLPALLREKLAAPSVEAGDYDLVIHPSNLWLVIHESVGHATELDRALGYEASYAGTSFATYDKLNTLQYGSPVMNVTGDRTVEHGLATIGYDDEGVETQSWDIVRDGVFVGYQLDRAMAHTYGAELNGGRSNGCAYADSPGHIPVQRMANVSLQPDPEGPDLEGLVSQVERGILVVGDKSWSIDQQRYNFQFTAQRFHAIEDGEVRGQLRDVAYQATTTDFWGSLDAVGGPQTWEMGGAMNCGKAQPGQSAPVSHGCPVALFRGIRVLNTTEEGSA